jgi:hypothetical protein
LNETMLGMIGIVHSFTQWAMTDLDCFGIWNSTQKCFQFWGDYFLSEGMLSTHGFIFQMTCQKLNRTDRESEIWYRSHIPRLRDPTSLKRVREPSKRFWLISWSGWWLNWLLKLFRRWDKPVSMLSSSDCSLRRVTRLKWSSRT